MSGSSANSEPHIDISDDIDESMQRNECQSQTGKGVTHLFSVGEGRGSYL